MKHTMQYSVGDEVAHVPSNEADEFNSVAKSQNITPEPIFTYRVSNKSGDVQQLDVPKAEYEEFAKTAADNGYKIEPLRLMTMEDGTERFFSARELRAFTRSDEYLNSPDGVEAKRRQEAANAEMERMEAERPGFLSELGRNMFTAGGIREVAEDSAWAKPYAYANDLANALVGGLLKGSAKIEQGIGHLVGSDWLVNDAKGGQALVERNLPTDMLDTKKPGAVNKVLDVGKGVAEVSGEFAPSMIPGVGQAYAASLVGAGSTIRYMQVYDDAIAHGCEPERAIALASLGATVDAGQNMLLMGKFKGIWKGEQAQLAQAAKEGLVRRLTKDTLKTGAIMSGGGMSQDVIDQAAEGAYWLDVGRTAKVGFDQFIEGGLFHLVNTGAHNATRIKWGDEAKGIPAGAARDMMEAPEGRALVFSNSPEAAQKIYMARRRGENVSRKMIEDLGLSGDTARTVADRNAIGDRLVEDYLAFKERVRTKMDDVQAASLADEIASRSDEGVNNPAFEKVWFKAVEQIKDARELDDPERRKQIVDEAVKTTETKGERLLRQKAVAKYNRERAAEDAERRAESEKAAAGEQQPMKVELYDVNGNRIEPVSAAEEPVKAPEDAKKATETPAEATKQTAEAPVEVPKTPDVRKSAENPPPTASEEVAPNKETPVAPSAPTPVLERPAASAADEAPKKTAVEEYEGRLGAKTKDGRPVAPFTPGLRNGVGSTKDFRDKRLAEMGTDFEHATYEQLQQITNEKNEIENRSKKIEKDWYASLPDGTIVHPGEGQAGCAIMKVDGKWYNLNADGKLDHQQLDHNGKPLGSPYRVEHNIGSVTTPIPESSRVETPKTDAKSRVGQPEATPSAHTPVQERPTESTAGEMVELSSFRGYRIKGRSSVYGENAHKLSKEDLDELERRVRAFIKIDGARRVSAADTWNNAKERDYYKAELALSEFEDTHPGTVSLDMISNGPQRQTTQGIKSSIEWLEGKVREEEAKKDGRTSEIDGRTSEIASDTELDYRSWLKKYKLRDSKKLRAEFERRLKFAKSLEENPPADTPNTEADGAHSTNAVQEDVSEAVLDRPTETRAGGSSPKERFEQRVVLGRGGNKVVAAVGKVLSKEQAEHVAKALEAAGVKYPSVVEKQGKYSVSYFSSEDTDKVISVINELKQKTKSEIKKESEENAAEERARLAEQERTLFLQNHGAESGIVEKMGFVNNTQKQAVVDAMLDNPTNKDWRRHLSIQSGKVLKFLKENGVDVSAIKDPDSLRKALIDFKENTASTKAEPPDESATGAKNQPEVSEKRVGKPASPELEQKNGTNSRSLSDAVRELMAAKDDLRSVERPTWTDKDTAEDKQKYHDEIIAPREKRIAELEAEIDSKRAPATDFEPFNGKTNPKKAAKLVADFVLNPSVGTNSSIMSPFHDKKNGVVVATDGRIMIATKHGFDPNGKSDDAFPNWKELVKFTEQYIASNGGSTVSVNPTAIIGACKNAVRFARTTGADEDKTIIAIKFGDRVKLYSTKYMMKAAKAMEANGISEITSGNGTGPSIAKNADTTIILAGLRGVDPNDVGRFDGADIVVNGHNGRIIAAPERTDTGYQYGHERLDQLKADYESYRARNVKTAKDTNLYKLIVEARKKGVSDPKAIYDGGKLNNKFDQLKPELKEDFAKWVNAESDEKTAELIAEYMMENDKYPSNKKERLREIAKIEKRIGAEDEIEGLIMRSDEARRFLGTDKPKAEAKPVEEKKAADENPVAEDKPVEPTNGGEDPADEPSRTKESVRLGFEISDLIFKHLKAQATAKNNASGRKLKDEAKAALVNRLSSLTDAEYADVKGRLKEIMSDAGLDPKKSGYVQAIFNAETAKRNAAKPKQEPKKLSLADAIAERVKSVEKEDWTAADKATDAIREAMESATDEELASAYKDAASKSTNVHRGIASELKHEIEGRGKTVRDTSELDSYLAGKKPMEAARIRKTLEKRIDFGGDVGVTTEAELVDKAVKGGKSVVTAEVTTSKSGKPKVNFLMDGNFITATAANYAKARGVKTDENSLARASEHLTLYSAVDAHETYMKSKGFTGGRIESYTSDKAIEELLLQRRFSNPLTPSDNVLAKALREVKDARIKRGDWDPGSVLGKDTKPAEPEAPKAKPGKFTDSVYETYRSELSFRDGAKIFAEDALDTARAKLDERIKKAEKAMEDSRGDNGTYKDEAAFDENAELVETLKGKRKELNEIGERIKHGFDDRAPKGETHAWLREVLSDINSVEKIDDYEDIGDFVSRRGEKRTGIKSIDKFNDKWYDEIDGRADPSTIGYGIEISWNEADRRIADYARTYLEEDISFDKGVYDKLSDAEKRAFDKLVDKLDDAKDMALNTDSTIEDARRYVEAHEAIRTYEESAKKYQSLMRDKDGRPVLFTDKGRADEMARDAAGGMVRAIGSGDKSAAGSAESALRLSVENGAEIPSKADVEKMAAELPEAKREAFVKYMDGWREYAKSMKDKPSIADEASKLADEVDAAIAVEEAESASGRPDSAPSGRGTGALPQDEPLPQGTTTTGKMRGIVTPQSFLKEARKLFPDVAIRGKGTMRMPKWAAGHFEGAYRVIRSRDMNAIRTITHELGHELEYLTRYDLPRTPAAKRDLSDLGHQLYPSGPGMPKPNSYIGEGFAEYIRGYICNAQNLHQVAPDMDAWFRGNFKAKHPEIVKKIDRLRDMVQTMKEQSAADTLRGFRHPATTVVERAWKKVTEFASSENWNDSASTILKGMKKSGIDKLFHWQDEFRELEAAVKAGDTVRAQRLAASVSDKIANHPYLFPTITRGTASQRVMDMARHGTTSLLGNVKTGESLKEIFSDFSHKEQEAWKDYAVARHGLENYYAKGLEFGMPKDVLEEVVRQYDSPKFQQALQRVTDYSHRILHLGVDSGLISQETYDSIVQNHPIYIRVTRRKAEDGAGTKQGGAAINKRTGGFENILDPIDAMLMDQEKFLRACFQARSMQLIVGAANRAKLANLKSIRDNGGPNTSTVNPANQSHIAVGAYWPIEVPNAQEKVTFAAGKLKQGLKEAADDYSARTGEDAIPIHEFINDLATYTDPMGNASMLSIFRDKPSNGKHNLVSVYVDGRLHTYELPDMKWANMLTDVYDKSDFNRAERMFGLATAGIRLGATTINPGFAIRNGIRDSLHSAVMSESGALPMLGTLNGMLNQLTGKEAAQMFRSMGGHMSDLVGITKEQKWHHGGQVALAQNPLQSLQAYGVVDWALMKPVIKVTSDILSLPELGPRIREFNGILQKCRAAGLTEDVSAMLAMSHAKDVSIDFQRAGRYMKHINHYYPFSNAMWRGTEQSARNLGLLNALPHQFEDRNLQRGMKTVGKGLAYITSWAATLAMLEMSGDEEDRRQAFEREPKEKWEYEHVGDWRIPLPFEMGYIFGALPKAAVYEMYGDKGAIKECLKSFSQAIPLKYLDPEIALGSVSLFTPIIGLLKNEDYRGRAIVPEHIKENRVKEDWYTQYTTELSKKIGGAIGESPAQIEYLLDSYTGGLYRRTALAVENIGDTSRLQQGRGFSMLDTLRARPQANRLVGDFYKFGEEAKQKLGSGKISLEEYGKFASMNGTKEELTAKFNAMREIRADKSIPLAEQDERVNEIAKEVNDAIRDFNARDDYRQRGIAYAASHLTGSTLESLDDETRRQYTDLLKDVPTGEIVQALIRFGNETVLVKQKGVKVPHQRWSNKNINERVNRLLMIMQRR